MEPPAKRPESAKPPQPRATGAPATYAAYALRKELSVRVSIRPVVTEPEELREDGYGHGV